MEDFSDYSAPELVKMLGSRFKEYRLRANMTCGDGRLVCAVCLSL